MAYNTKYVLKYCSRYGDKLRVELQIDGYVGQAFLIANDGDYVSDDLGRNVSLSIDGSFNPDRDMNAVEGSDNPFTLQYRNDTGEKGGAIRATSATMSFFEDMMFNIDDLATSDETGIRCKFFVNDLLEWIGFVTPDFFNVEIASNPVINLTASDRLGILKDVSYPLDDFYKSSRVSKLYVLNECLKKTGLELPINICCQLYCAQFELSDNEDPELPDYLLSNYLQDSYVSELRFVTDEENEETLNCYDIIQKILNEGNCLLTQRNGEWWIINKADLASGYSYQHFYPFDSLVQEFKGLISFGESYFNLIDTGGQRTLIPAGAKNTYLLDHGRDRMYPVNSRLQGGNSPAFYIDRWARVENYVGEHTFLIPTQYDSNGQIVSSYQDNRRNLRVISRIVSNPNPSIGTIDVAWRDRCFQSELFNIGGTNDKSFDVEFSIDAIGKPFTGILCRLCLYFPSDNILFVSSHLDNGQQYYAYNYSTISTSNTLYPIPFFEFEDRYKDPNIAVRSKFTVNKSTSISYLKSCASSFGLNLVSNSFSDAVMYVRLYPGFTRASNVLMGIIIKSIEVNFKSDDQVPKSTVFETILEANYTKPTEQRNVLFGDFQTEGQNGYFYKYREDSLSIQYSRSGVRLKDWYTPFDTSLNPMLVHSLRQLTDSYGRSHDELSIGFQTQKIDPLSLFAVRCFTNDRVKVESDDKQLADVQSRDVTARVGRYLNNKRFVMVEGEFDYLRSKFTGKLAEIVNSDPDTQEYIFSKFDNNTN